MTDQNDNDDRRAEWKRTSYHGVTMDGRTWLDARDRHHELSQRELLARGRARMEARGETVNRAPHLDDRPLTVTEHLELLATGEVVARVYRHPGQVHQALQAGATWEQIAEATGTGEARVRQEYREFAEGQHDMWAGTGHWEGAEPHRLGMPDDEFAAAIARTGDEASDARVPLESEGQRQVPAYLDQAEGREAGSGE